MKKCNRCLLVKPISEFYTYSGSNTPMSKCKVCHNNQTMSYYHKNPELMKEQSKKRYETNKEKILKQHKKWQNKNVGIMRVYSWKVRGVDITYPQYVKMFNEQNGECKICKVKSHTLKKGLAVDHSHITDEIRGLLCGKCNRGIGMFNDNPALLQIASHYVKFGGKANEKPNS